MKTGSKKTLLLWFVFTATFGFLISMGSAHAQTAVPCTPPDPAADPNPYAGIASNPDTMFKHPQFQEVPSAVTTNDNFIAAPGQGTAPAITPCPGAPWADPVIGYATYLFCSPPIPPDPIYSVLPTGVPTLSQWAAHDRFEQTIKAAADEFNSMCLKFRNRRIAYSSTSTPIMPAGAGGGLPIDPITGCDPNLASYPFCVQNIACHNLKDPGQQAASAQANALSDSTNAALQNSATSTPAFGIGNSGYPTYNPPVAATPSSTGPAPVLGASNTVNASLGIQHINDWQLDGALADCDTWGLSEEAQDAIKAHECEDAGRASAVAANAGGGAAGEAAVTKCLEQGPAYEREVNQQENQLREALDRFKAAVEMYKEEHSGSTVPHA
jgi:hypothetical protein